MKKSFISLLAGIVLTGPFTAGATEAPAPVLPLTTGRLDEPAAKRLSEQSIDSEAVNGTVSVTLYLDAAALKKALRGERLQVLDIHLKAGRKSATNVGYAIEGGDIYFTHMRFHRAQFDVIAGGAAPTLAEFVKDAANVDSVQAAVITFVHATGQNEGPVEFGSYYHLDLYTADGVKSFSGYAEKMKVSDRRLGSVSIPEGSPALRGLVFPEQALTPEQAAAANARVSAAAGSAD